MIPGADQNRQHGNDAAHKSIQNGIEHSLECKLFLCLRGNVVDLFINGSVLGKTAFYTDGIVDHH